MEVQEGYTKHLRLEQLIDLHARVYRPRDIRMCMARYSISNDNYPYNNYSLYTRNCYILSLDPGSIIIFMSACTVQADASRHQACMFCFHYRRGIVSLLCINC